MGNGNGEVVYRVDGDDRLVEMNDRWDTFALHNDGPHLLQRNVINQSLWTYIQSAEIRLVHRTLLQRVRSKKEILNLPFRCDSPTLRRYMEMDLSPLPRRGVEFRCRLLKVEPRDAVALLAVQQSARHDLVRMCSWCKKVEVGEGRWREIEEAVVSLALLRDEPLPMITHGICDACLAALGIDHEA